MNGSFSEEALLRFSELAAQSQSANFSEGGTYDFTRCVRPNGTAYGTDGRCRKGTEGAAIDKEKLRQMTPSDFRNQLEQAAENAKRAKGTSDAEKAKENLKEALDLHKQGIQQLTEDTFGSWQKALGVGVLGLIANQVGVRMPHDTMKNARTQAIQLMKKDQAEGRTLYESL